MTDLSSSATASGSLAHNNSASLRMSTDSSKSGAGGAAQLSFDSNTAAPSMRSSGRTSSVVSTRGGDTASVNFFRGFLGHRHQDYHTDAPPPPPAAVSLRSGFRQPQSQQQQSSSMIPNTIHEAGPSSPSESRRFSSATTTTARRSNRRNNNVCSNDAKHRRSIEQNTLCSHAWKAVLIVFAFVLLFGAQIRALFIPQAGDLAVDVVFMIALVFFATDIVMRIDSEDGYFSWYFCKNNKICSIGSFLFWCDFVSTLTLIYDLSFISWSHYQEEFIGVTLGDYGVPVSGLGSLKPAKPVKFDKHLIITICRTARVARFIRSSRAVKISSRVNWYLLLNLFNPCWWWDQCRFRIRSRRRRRGVAVSLEAAAQRGASPTDIGGTTTSNLATARSSTGNNNTATASGGGLTPSDHNNEINAESPSRRTTWGRLGMGALAAVKATHDPENKGWKHKTMRMLGRQPFDMEDVRRHFAATRIQRAWRRSLQQRRAEDAYSSEFMGPDVAWKGRMSESHKRSHQRTSTPPSTPRGGRRPDSALLSTANSTDQQQNGSNGAAKHRNESQVGSAMRELTGQRVAIGIIIALILTVVFTYVEYDLTRPSTMIVLHNQTGNDAFADKALMAARGSSIPDLFSYTLANGEERYYPVVESGLTPDELRPREQVRIVIDDAFNGTTVGLFSNRNEVREQAMVSLLTTIFILLIWFFGVTAFAGPVMVLVVIPIERMVRLLGMLMVDPLGYQSTSRYKRFVDEENEITKNTRWTKEILKGMETSFLMSTILRIGSLMKVGFGSAGVEIIRNNLEKGQSKNMLILSSQGSTVSCIFLFCDIRSFTDATECLQEEVFVFTNRIAAVVHSICHSYGGSANKNIGDAFLLSWPLDDDDSSATLTRDDSFTSFTKSGEGFTAKNNQADKALLSVVKICMALHYDDYYIEAMTDAARKALVTKLKNRKGPIVQMGFGLHAGRAVQGAIGSQRKIDATYVSEAVERAEFLESSTKKYALKMLMSDSFHRLLHPSNRRRCRKIDQILIREEEDESDEGILDGDIIELFTFDMNIQALWDERRKALRSSKSDTGRDSDSVSDTGSKRGGLGMLPRTRRLSWRGKNAMKDMASEEISEHYALGVGVGVGTLGVGVGVGVGNSQRDLQSGGTEGTGAAPPKLILPTGPALYNANVWTNEEMRTLRQLYSDGLFFQKFSSGLQSFYSKDWDHAKQCFSTILERFEDGPSRYFLTQIENCNGKPPRDFLGYGTA